MNKTNRKQPLFHSFHCAFSGIVACIRQERNMKIHLSAVAAVITAGLIFRISRGEWVTCLICFALVMGSELINTAIEATVDLACPREDPKAKLAKDAAAGAVLICAIFSAAAGLMIFLPKLANLIS